MFNINIDNIGFRDIIRAVILFVITSVILGVGLGMSDYTLRMFENRSEINSMNIVQRGELHTTSGYDARGQFWTCKALRTDRGISVKGTSSRNNPVNTGFCETYLSPNYLSNWEPYAHDSRAKTGQVGSLIANTLILTVIALFLIAFARIIASFIVLPIIAFVPVSLRVFNIINAVIALPMLLFVLNLALSTTGAGWKPWSWDHPNGGIQPVEVVDVVVDNKGIMYVAPKDSEFGIFKYYDNGGGYTVGTKLGSAP